MCKKKEEEGPFKKKEKGLKVSTVISFGQWLNPHTHKSKLRSKQLMIATLSGSLPPPSLDCGHIRRMTEGPAAAAFFILPSSSSSSFSME